MSTFLPNTILKRTKAKKDPLDRIKVIADSPTKDATIGGWEGSDGACVLIEPLAGFGAVEIAPVDMLHDEYEIESVPEDEPIVHVDPRRIVFKTPEQQFAAMAREKKKTAAEEKAAKAEAKKAAAQAQTGDQA